VDQPVSFATITTVLNPPVIIYVSGASTIDLSNNVINEGNNAADFRLLVNGAIPIDLGTGGHAVEFTGVLYAPKVDLVSPGCMFLPNGSVTVNTFRCQGGPNFTARYDDALSEVTSDWHVVDWHEIPSG
jgi:hypothetical protein